MEVYPSLFHKKGNRKHVIKSTKQNTQIYLSNSIYGYIAGSKCFAPFILPDIIVKSSNHKNKVKYN